MALRKTKDLGLPLVETKQTAAGGTKRSQQGHLRRTTATMLLNFGSHVKIVLGYLPRLPNPRTHLNLFVFCIFSVETIHIFLFRLCHTTVEEFQCNQECFAFSLFKTVGRMMKSVCLAGLQ